MQIGYACQIAALPGYGMRTCAQRSATPALLEELIAHNLDILERMLDYNIAHEIRLFRISSDIIPFGSSPVNTLDWAALFGDKLAALGRKARGAGMRLSMHPGQYTVLSTPSAEVLARAVEDLRYHCAFLDALGLDGSHKLILHLGGVYGDKAAAMDRFAKGWSALDDGVKARLVIENDDKLYHIADLLAMGRRLGVPVVFDNLHHEINPPPGDTLSQAGWVALCRETWTAADGPQKTHYSQQAPDKKPGAHAATIDPAVFAAYLDSLPAPRPDVMLEVKDKNVSALKCIDCVRERGRIKHLEAAWARYKYAVLEHDPAAYRAARELLKDKTAYPAQAFYRLMDKALAREITPGHAQNAAEHVWGHLRARADERARRRYESLLARYLAGTGSLRALKNHLLRLAEAQGELYLLAAYYFDS